ncbi:hypothetical protein PQX77_008661 [Marasmius sp. AFHP31]|nr:hypothetical protein PQX77_008661 [Marasmius sp. AFHP31]
MIAPVLSNSTLSRSVSHAHVNSDNQTSASSVQRGTLPSPITPSNSTSFHPSNTPDLSSSFSSSPLPGVFHSNRSTQPFSDPFCSPPNPDPPTPVEQITFASKPRTHKPPRSEHEKLRLAIYYIVDELGFDSMGTFLLAYFQQIPKLKSRSFGKRHKRSVRAFLQNGKAVQLLEMMYTHRYSNPSYKSSSHIERQLAFSPTTPPSGLNYARSAISSWSVQLVGARAHWEVGKLTVDEENKPIEDANISVRMAASANDRTRAKGVRVVTREDLLSFNVAQRIRCLKRRAPLTWYLTEQMAGPRTKGQVIVRKKRPTPS